MRSNKGFSLVEMIVSFAILAVCGLAVFGFMQSGQNSFTRTSTDVGLQYEQQVVVNQLRDLLLESTNSAKYDPENKMLYSYSQDVSKEKNESTGEMEYVYKYIVTRVSHDVENQKLYWNENTFTKADLPGDLEGVVGSFNEENNKLLGENVRSIDFDMSKLKEGQITFTVTFLSEGKEITSTQVVMLRNKLIDTEDFGIMFTDLSEEKNSFIKGISMSRDGVVFPLSGGTDIIKKDASGDVAIQYEAIVTGSTYSEYDYECYFEISDLLDVYNDVYTGGGITVDPSSGVVTVQSSVPNGVSFKLWAISVDDPSRIKTNVTITIQDGGLYPKSVVLAEQRNLMTEEAGRRVYTIYPSITYSDNVTVKSGKNAVNLLSYVVMRDGNIVTDAFNPETGELTVSSADNGHVFTITGYVKQKNALAQVVYNDPPLTITVSGVSSAAANQTLSLSTSSYMDNLRGNDDLTAAVTWNNANSSLYNYHWTIEPVNVEGDDSYGVWGNTNINSFDKNIKFTEVNLSNIVNSGNVKSADSDRNHTGVYFTCSDTLQWNKHWRVKVTCYATSAKPGADQNIKYGLTNDKGEYVGPAEGFLDIEPVKFIVTPYDYAQNSVKVDTALKLKNTRPEGRTDSGADAKALRVFKVYARGLYLTQSNFSNYSKDVEFKFYNKNGGEISTDLANSNLFGLSDQVPNQGGMFVGFYVNVRPGNESATGAKAMLNTVSIIRSRFMLYQYNYRDTNIARAYFMPSGLTNYCDDENIQDMLTLDYYISAQKTFEERGPAIY